MLLIEGNEGEQALGHLDVGRAAVAALAVLLVAEGDDTIHIHMLIATALGVGLSVLLGIALMTLVFLSSRMGQDADAADHSQKDDDDPQ